MLLPVSKGLRTSSLSPLFVWGSRAGEDKQAMVGGGQEEGEDSHQIGKDNHVFELARQPDQIERVLVDGHLLGQSRRVITA